MQVAESSHQKSSRARFATRVWIIAVLLGLGYFATALARSGVAFEELASIPKAIIIGWKGAYTFALAGAVLASPKNSTTLIVAGAFAIIAVADMLLVSVGLIAGGIGFAIAHLVAIAAYARSSAAEFGLARRIAAWVFPVFAVGLSCAALFYGGENWVTGFFVLLSSTMAAVALLSRFPLHLTGLGAVIFVFSDIIYFVSVGLCQGAGHLGWAVWLCFSSGLALMARGAMQFSEERHGKL